MRSNWHRLILLTIAAIAISASASERVVESVLPALAYGSSCSSTIRLKNLAEVPATVDLEAHRASGALVALKASLDRVVRLEPGQQIAFQLEVDDETTAWVKMREKIPEGQPSPAVAFSGITECHDDNQLRVASREVAYPTPSPWFSGDVADLHGAVLTLINASEQPARAAACYSAGTLYSVPSASRTGADLVPLCSATLDVQIPPFGTREFPVERGGNSHFALKTRGDAIVLQMLRPADEHVHIYSVDSTIQFGEEVPEPRRPAK